MFMWSMVVYSIIMAYNTFCAVYVVVTDLRDRSNVHLGNNIFTNLIVSTASTVGLYFLMSFLYLDPWHMFTSAAQYFALLPSYICTLQVYAFCNTHDITWGTKGDNVIHTDLGAAVSAKAGNTVSLEMPSEQLDIDSGYDEALRNLRDRVEVPKDGVSESQQQEDYYRAVRTYMVTIWMVTNATLAMAISEAYDSSKISDNFYLTFILWAVAALALFRAIGSSTFGIINIISAIAEGRMKLKLNSVKVPDWVSDSGSKVSSGFSWVSSGTKSMASSLGLRR
jgi:chitin synthase